MSMHTKRLALALLSSLPVLHGAALADPCAEVAPAGRYHFERNLSIVNTGPVSCASTSVHTAFNDLSNTAQSSVGGGPVQARAVPGLAWRLVPPPISAPTMWRRWMYRAAW